MCHTKFRILNENFKCKHILICLQQRNFQDSPGNKSIFTRKILLLGLLIEHNKVMGLLAIKFPERLPCVITRKILTFDKLFITTIRGLTDIVSANFTFNSKVIRADYIYFRNFRRTYKSCHSFKMVKMLFCLYLPNVLC